MCIRDRGRTIPCISAKGQKVFHTGYELREVDKHDIRNIDHLLAVQASGRDETGGEVCQAKKDVYKRQKRYRASMTAGISTTQQLVP